MDSYRIRVKIGPYEFEAEGPPELVKEQFDTFRSIVASVPENIGTDNPYPVDDAPNVRNVDGVISQPKEQDNLDLSRIFRIGGRVVSLTVLPQDARDAILLILLGQRQFRTNDQATGAEVKDGLSQSGYRIDRTDRVIDKLEKDGAVIKVGFGKASRYRLTNQGYSRGMALAKDLIGKLP
ncbi:MAG TPA: hypothetical protein VG893_01235 [Terracidiphilus sp.]|nr:hypothetical protein [Terracidiphilus sp.]